MQKILFVQSGDYREAYLKFKEGGPETFRDQERSVAYVAALAPQARITTLALGHAEYTRTELAPELWAASLRRDAVSRSQLADLFGQDPPTHVVLRTPHFGILRQARRCGAYVLPCFADIFGRGGPNGRGGPRTLLRNFFFRRELMRCKAPCFANHSLNASRSLVDVLGLPQGKVVPWDWSHIPVTHPAKTHPADETRPTAFFAGALIEEKGVGDCFEAVAALKKENIHLHMTFAGGGALEGWQSRARELGISDQIHLLGMIPNAEVRRQMNAHDFVVVPSRHSYPEGLPNTIYEALASRSVLVISDHPAFAGRLVADEDALIFTASNPNALAQCLKKGVTERALYAKISGRSKEAHDRLYAGLEWTRLVETFLADPDNCGKWVERYSLDSLTDQHPDARSGAGPMTR